MITELRVRDLLVIHDATLRLQAGFNVLTGETGAGKSMLVDALALLLGERASTELIRPGAERARVEAAFDLERLPGIRAVLDELGLDADEGQLVVRREINSQGRNRAWANGSPTTVATLGKLGRHLVDLHGQHETQSLLRPSAQRSMLDAFGGAQAELARVASAYDAVVGLRVEEAELTAKRREVLQRADYLRHLVGQIEEAKPLEGEDEELGVEAKRLANVEQLTRLVESLVEGLDESDRNALEVVGGASRSLHQLARIDESVSPWRELLDAAQANLEELVLAARGYLAEIDRDPGRLAEVELRRDVLFRLKQKYGPTLSEVLHTAQEARGELALLDTADDHLHKLAERRAAAEHDLEQAAARLTAKRRRAATRLARAVQEQLPGLGMPEGSFSVLVRPAEVTRSGADEVRFSVQLNPGLEAGALSQVASGGELSRLMLALKVVLAGQDAIPTLVFDEVDQGIGGEVAQRVGEALARVGGSRQVLAITHLPQIAARASYHVSIAKRSRGGIATADVQEVRGDARRVEIARMLGSAADPVVARHADELLRVGGETT